MGPAQFPGEVDVLVVDVFDLSLEVSVHGVPPLSLTFVESKLCATAHNCLELICLKDLGLNSACP